MNDIDRESENSELIAMLRADFTPAHALAKERVSQRLAASVGALILNGPPRLPAPPARSLAPMLAALPAYPLVFVAVFALGGASGAGLVVALRSPSKPEIRYVDRAVARPAATLPSPPTAPAIIASAPLPPVLPPKPTVSVHLGAAPSAERSSVAQLAEQQALLDIARQAFARSDYSSTLQTLDAHFKRYPKSVLGEEREALQIKTLAATGQVTEARVRASRFKARFPQSLLLPSLTESIGAIP